MIERATGAVTVSFQDSVHSVEPCMFAATDVVGRTNSMRLQKWFWVEGESIDAEATDLANHCLSSEARNRRRCT